MDDVRAIEAMDEVSYWDRSIAAVAGAAAATGDEAIERRAEVAALAERLEDVIVSSYVRRFLDEIGHHRHEIDAHPVPIGGWAEVADALAASASS